MDNHHHFKNTVNEEKPIYRQPAFPVFPDTRGVDMVKLASISECGSLISVISENDSDTQEVEVFHKNNENTDPEKGSFVDEPKETDDSPPKLYNPADMVNIKHGHCCLGTDCIATIFCATLTLVALAYSLYRFGHRMPTDSSPNINLTCVKPEIIRTSGGQLMLNYTLNVAFEPPSSVVSANYELVVYDNNFHYIGTSKLNLLQTNSVNGDQTFMQIAHGIGSVKVSLPFLNYIPLSHTILAVFTWEEVDYTHCNKESCPWSSKNHTTFLDVVCSIAKKW